MWITKTKFQSTQVSNLVQAFLWKKCKIAFFTFLTVFLRNQFLMYFGISFDVSSFLQVTLNFKLKLMNVKSRHANSKFAHQILSIDHASRCKLKDYMMTHTKKKPSTTNCVCVCFFSLKISKTINFKRVSKI